MKFDEYYFSNWGEALLLSQLNIIKTNVIKP